MSVHAPSSSYAKTPVLPSLKGVTIKRELAYLGKRAVCIKLENKIWQGDHLFSLPHLITKKKKNGTWSQPKYLGRKWDYDVFIFSAKRKPHACSYGHTDEQQN